MTSYWPIAIWPLYSYFISGFDSNGNFQWATSFWQSNEFGAGAMVTDGLGSLYAFGSTDQWADYDPGPGIEQYESWAWEGTLYKIGTDGTW